MLSPILADFGGIGVLFLVAISGGSLILSVGVALFDRRVVQFVLTATSCLFFGLSSIGFAIGVFQLLRGATVPNHYPAFALMIPPITAIQFILYAIRLRRSSRPPT